MAGAEAYRAIVEARAAGACEYCRLLQAPTGVTFHLEHIVPLSRGGETEMNNLALSCPGCNLSKGEQMTGIDGNARSQPLFNPRNFHAGILGWHLHFALDRDSGIVVPRTPVGEATVQALKMNAPLRVFARKLQILAGLIS